VVCAIGLYTWNTFFSFDYRFPMYNNLSVLCRLQHYLLSVCQHCHMHAFPPSHCRSHTAPVQTGRSADLPSYAEVSPPSRLVLVAELLINGLIWAVQQPAVLYVSAWPHCGSTVCILHSVYSVCFNLRKPVLCYWRSISTISIHRFS